MRQFILGANADYPTKTVDAAAAADAGKVGFAYLDANGKTAFTATGAEIKDKGVLVLLRQGAAGNVVLPIYKHHFSYVKGVYQAAAKPVYTVTLPEDIIPNQDYTIILVKKGVKFNERNKWSATVHAKSSDTTATIGAALLKYFQDNVVGTDVTVTYADKVLTFTANTKDCDFTVVPADYLVDAAVVNTTAFKKAYGDADYVADLANKAAADAGFEYTLMDDVHYMYPNYPLDPLAQPKATDVGYTIFTLKFSEPREVKTVDDVVNQIIQVAFPTGSASIETFETVCKALVD